MIKQNVLRAISNWVEFDYQVQLFSLNFSSTLGSYSNSPSALFVASDGSGLRMFQAVIDARTLLLEVGAQKRDVSIALLSHFLFFFKIQKTMNMFDRLHWWKVFLSKKSPRYIVFCFLAGNELQQQH